MVQVNEIIILCRSGAPWRNLIGWARKVKKGEKVEYISLPHITWNYRHTLKTWSIFNQSVTSTSSNYLHQSLHVLPLSLSPTHSQKSKSIRDLIWTALFVASSDLDSIAKHAVCLWRSDNNLRGCWEGERVWIRSQGELAVMVDVRCCCLICFRFLFIRNHACFRSNFDAAASFCFGSDLSFSYFFWFFKHFRSLDRILIYMIRQPLFHVCILLEQ